MSEKSPISIDEILDSKSILKSIGGDNKHKLNFSHLNINATIHKFDLLAVQVAINIDVLMISETKIDASFPVGNFLLPRFRVIFGDLNVEKESYMKLFCENHHLKTLTKQPTFNTNPDNPTCLH